MFTFPIAVIRMASSPLGVLEKQAKSPVVFYLQRIRTLILLASYCLGKSCTADDRCELCYGWTDKRCEKLVHTIKS